MHRAIVCIVLSLVGRAFGRDPRPILPVPTQFEIGRHTFFDFGPPTDFYELFLARPSSHGTTIERITLTPAADSCLQPATIEVAKGEIEESIATLLGTRNPCAIPEKELRRERKRCKKCLVFSGANIVMRVQCGSRPRMIRSDILDRDMFDPAAKTTEHTSWTMQIMARLDRATGPGVMERPMFGILDTQKGPPVPESSLLGDIASGHYDAFFESAPDKPSDLYRAAQIPVPKPSIKLIESSPIQPVNFTVPEYPPIAKLARIEGIVRFSVDIDSDGRATNFTVKDGHPMLRGAVEKATASWQFPVKEAQKHVFAAVDFKTNCPAKSN